MTFTWTELDTSDHSGVAINAGRTRQRKTWAEAVADITGTSEGAVHPSHQRRFSTVLYDKQQYSTEVEIEVKHPRYPGALFTFTFTKEISEAMADAQKEFFALPDNERPEIRRQKLIATVALMLTRIPTGFARFPEDERPLSDRVREYFDEPTQPELHAILVAAWNMFWEVSVPRAYLKSGQNYSEAANNLSGVSG